MSKEKMETIWTPARVRETIDAMCHPFDEVPFGPDFEEAFHRACFLLEPKERLLLRERMRIMAIALEHFRAMLMGWGSPNLLGAAAETTELMSLLYAVDPEQLSIDVLESLSVEVLDLLSGSWSALPPRLHERLCRRAEEQARMDEAEVEAEEAAAEEAAREAKNGRKH